MSLPTWLAAGWLQPHKTSPAEIRELWLIVGRDLADAASGGISADWQYGIAYNAALKLCTILLYAEGYQPGKGAMAHSRTLNALPHILGAQRKSDADYPGWLPPKTKHGGIRPRRRRLATRCRRTNCLRPRTAHGGLGVAAGKARRPRTGIGTKKTNANPR